MVFGLFRRGGRDNSQHQESDDWTEPKFVCERLCTTPKLLRKIGAAKEPSPNTCVTVCGTSSIDACTDACQRTACANLHHVPAWNDACVSRCANECLKLRRDQ